MIDAQRLHILREVARHGSFNRAAGALRCTPSAVSQQIAALERTVGTPVVKRSTRGVVLTEQGQLLVEAAEAISAELRHAQEQIKRLAAGPATLTVATFSSGGRRLLPPALTRFTAEHPGVELTILESEPEESLQMVREGRADLAIAYHFDEPQPIQQGDRPGLVWSPVLEDPLWVVLPENHPYADAASVRLTDLANERWVLGCLKTANLLERHATLAGFQLRISCRATDYFFAMALVGAGVGVSLIPQIALDQPLVRMAMVPLDPPRPIRHIGVVTRQRSSGRSQAHIDAFVDALLADADLGLPVGPDRPRPF